MRGSLSAMRDVMWIVCGLVVISALPDAASAAPPSCTKAAQRKVRAAAEKAVKAKDYKAAIARLEPVRAACGDAPDAVESAWLAADLAAAYEKAGQPLACEQLMAQLASPRARVADAGNDKVLKAIEYNLDRCSKAIDAQYAAIKPGGCALTIEHAVATAAAPAALVPRGATAACIALVPGTPAKHAEPDDVTCPQAVLVWKAARLERQSLTTASTAGTADAISDSSICCNLTSIAAGTRDGKHLVRVRGDGRDCNGGTADAATDLYYEWKGTSLTTVLDRLTSTH